MNYTALENSPLFRGLSREEIEAVTDDVSYRVQHYEKEETILHAMDPADRIGIVLTGRAQAQKTFPNGSQVNVSVRMPGEMIGAAAAFSEAGRYPCDVVAMDTMSVLTFQKNDLLFMMNRDPVIMRNFLTQMASAAYMLQQRLELVSDSGSAQKAAFYLLMFERRTGKKRFPIPGSMTKWAMMMNVSRTSLHRELGRMEKEGLIRYAPPVIEILDTDGLQEALAG